MNFILNKTQTLFRNIKHIQWLQEWHDSGETCSPATWFHATPTPATKSQTNGNRMGDHERPKSWTSGLECIRQAARTWHKQQFVVQLSVFHVWGGWSLTASTWNTPIRPLITCAVQLLMTTRARARAHARTQQVSFHTLQQSQSLLTDSALCAPQTASHVTRCTSNSTCDTFCLRHVSAQVGRL